jgi:hypothetical protein
MPSHSPLAECPAKRAGPFEIAKPISCESTRILRGHSAFFWAGNGSDPCCPRLPWTRCPFCSTSTLKETGSGVASRRSLLRRGVDL